MNVTTVQADVRSPTGQRGADVIRRPQGGGQQSAPQSPSGQGIENVPNGRPLSRSDQVSEPYPYRPEPGGQQPPAQAPVQNPPQRQRSEPAEVEPAPIETPEQSPDEWSRRYAQLQRQQRQMYQQSQNLQRFESQLREREQNIRAHEETMGLAKTDPKSFIEKNGLSYEQLTDIYLNDGKPTPDHLIKSLQDEISSLRERLDNDQNQGREADARKQIEGFQNDIRGEIEKDASGRYQLIKAKGAFDTVFQVVEAYFAKTKADTGFGIVLPISEAADYVEKDLYSEAEKLLSLPRFQQSRQQGLNPEDHPEAQQRSGERPQQSPQPQRQPQRPQQSTHGQNSIVRDQSGIVGGINNLSYAQQTKRQAANMLRFNR